MVVGIPNVGKSSLINAMRTHTLGIKRKAVEAGARPGVTVRVQNRVRIMDKPPIYIIDTPGVLSPNHRNIEDAMKLALCDLVLESHVNLYYLAGNTREDMCGERLPNPAKYGRTMGFRSWRQTLHSVVQEFQIRGL
ncbi:hypothetical protein GCK72_011616 [Caenorhabditis remanei]|uniref:G domain-containing protein n=1 Tax=Caenorhabditis remanei TaxID=31234 RepID=A0A6A5H696_CAERE|nr:hypothetical protein GCK72_011616 [Caenorhabditis remanei]KAF1763350.1 hypothetical protein GCK72_011616 [Caenorhabditis remanei]